MTLAQEGRGAEARQIEQDVGGQKVLTHEHAPSRIALGYTVRLCVP